MKHIPKIETPTTILVVDDVPDNLRVLFDMLSRQGYDVQISTSASLALNAVNTNPPDLILLDIMMPGIDGYDMCRRLKAHEHTSDIPVIFLSALEDTENKIKGFSVGAVDYITKPFHVDEVLARVATHLKIRELQKIRERQNARLQQEIYARKQAEENLQNTQGQLEKQIEQRTATLQQEIIERKRVEEELTRYRDTLERLVEERTIQLQEYQEAIEESKDMIAVVDRHYKYRMVNRAFLNFRRRTRDSVLTRSVEEILGEAHFTTTVKPYLDRCLQGESIRFEMLRDDHQAQRHELEVFYYPLRNQAGEITRVVINISDITERKQAEKELQETKDALEAANRHLEERVREELQKRHKQEELLIQRSKLESLGKLAAGIAHEINQPLAGISMGLDNMLLKISTGKMSDEYFTRKIEVLLGHIDRIKHIIDHIRTFSREQASASIERVDVNQVCHNASSMLRTQYNHHNIEVELRLNKVSGFVLGNSYKLEQVILNLLANARDAVDDKETELGSFSYHKQITITTACDRERIFIDVRDNGTGMSEEQQRDIFDPFFTTKAPERGTGLGLSVSYGIIKDMQGDITVESRFGEYTLIRMSFPKIQE